MANTIFDLSASGELLLHGAQEDAIVEFNAGDVLSEFNKVDAYFVFDGKNTVTVPLIFTQSVSQEIDLKQISSAPKLFSKVGVYCGLYDDITTDEDLYESITTNTVVLTFAGKTLADYGITDAYTKTEANNLLSGKADKATSLSGYGITDAYTKTEINTMIGDIESLLSHV